MVEQEKLLTGKPRVDRTTILWKNKDKSKRKVEERRFTSVSFCTAIGFSKL
jgi:hypothetical protein